LLLHTLLKVPVPRAPKSLPSFLQVAYIYLLY